MSSTPARATGSRRGASDPSPTMPEAIDRGRWIRHRRPAVPQQLPPGDLLIVGRTIERAQVEAPLGGAGSPGSISCVFACSVRSSSASIVFGFSRFMLRSSHEAPRRERPSSSASSAAIGRGWPRRRWWTLVRGTSMYGRLAGSSRQMPSARHAARGRGIAWCGRCDRWPAAAASRSTASGRPARAVAGDEVRSQAICPRANSGERQHRRPASNRHLACRSCGASGIRHRLTAN